MLAYGLERLGAIPSQLDGMAALGQQIERDTRPPDWHNIGLHVVESNQPTLGAADAEADIRRNRKSCPFSDFPELTGMSDSGRSPEPASQA